MSKTLDFKIDDAAFKKSLQKLQTKSPKAFNEAVKVGATQFLTWCNDGSEKNTRVPPIDKGFLRGSSSVFVGADFVGAYNGEDNKDALKAFSTNSQNNITIIYNSAYANKMHETEYNLGEKSARSGNAGNKWLESHLDSDKDALMKVIALNFEKRLKA